MEPQPEDKIQSKSRKCWKLPKFLSGGFIIRCIAVIEPLVLAVTVVTVAFHLAGKEYWYFADTLVLIYIQFCYDLWMGATRIDYDKLRNWLLVKALPVEYCIMLVLANYVFQITPADWLRLIVFTVWRLVTFAVVGLFAILIRPDQNTSSKNDCQEENVTLRLKDKIWSLAVYLVTDTLAIVVLSAGLISYITNEKCSDACGIILALLETTCIIAIVVHGVRLYQTFKKKRILTSQVRKEEGGKRNIVSHQEDAVKVEKNQNVIA